MNIRRKSILLAVVLVQIVCVLSGLNAQNSLYWVKVSPGVDFTIALRSDGTIWAWGANQNGQLGQGFANSTNVTFPIQVGSDNDWRDIAAGGFHSLALKQNGSLWAWGNNFDGQCGQDTDISLTITQPQLIPSSSVWRKIEAGQAHSLAISNNGALYAWGYNEQGQLGIGSFISTHQVSRVGSSSNWKSISAGGYHTLATNNNNNLFTWGNNFRGQLGTGNTNQRSVPQMINIGQAGVIEIAAGFEHSAVIDVFGNLWTFGANYFGQLGLGTISAGHSIPVRINLSNELKKVTAGSGNSFVITSTGDILGTGLNLNGAIGLGSDINSRTQFTHVNTGNFRELVAAKSYLITIDTTNYLFGWHTTAIDRNSPYICATGNNNVGQLGNGSNQNSFGFQCNSGNFPLSLPSLSCRSTIIERDIGSVLSVSEVTNNATYDSVFFNINGELVSEITLESVGLISVTVTGFDRWGIYESNCVVQIDVKPVLVPACKPGELLFYVNNVIPATQFVTSTSTDFIIEARINQSNNWTSSITFTQRGLFTVQVRIRRSGFPDINCSVTVRIIGEEAVNCVSVVINKTQGQILEARETVSNFENASSVLLKRSGSNDPFVTSTQLNDLGVFTYLIRITFYDNTIKNCEVEVSVNEIVINDPQRIFCKNEVLTLAVNETFNIEDFISVTGQILANDTISLYFNNESVNGLEWSCSLSGVIPVNISIIQEGGLMVNCQVLVEIEELSSVLFFEPVAVEDIPADCSIPYRYYYLPISIQDIIEIDYPGSEVFHEVMGEGVLLKAKPGTIDHTLSVSYNYEGCSLTMSQFIKGTQQSIIYDPTFSWYSVLTEDQSNSHIIRLKGLPVGSQVRWGYLDRSSLERTFLNDFSMDHHIIYPSGRNRSATLVFADVKSEDNGCLVRYFDAAPDDIFNYRGSTSPNETITAEWTAVLYPNPVNSQLTIQLEDAKDMDFELYIIHATGKKVYSLPVSMSATNMQLHIPTSNLAPGNYIVQIRDKQGLRMENLKLVKL